MRNSIPIISLLLALGCNTLPDPDELTTIAHLGAPQVFAGGTLTVTLAAVNPSWQTVEFLGSPDCFLGFRVETIDGRNLGGFQRPCPARLDAIVLEGGETRVVRLDWDLTTLNGPLAPGTYRVIAGVSVAGHVLPEAESRPVVLRVLVPLTPPPPP